MNTTTSNPRRALLAIAGAVLGGCLVGTVIGVSIAPWVGGSAATPDGGIGIVDPAPDRDPGDVLALLAAPSPDDVPDLDWAELGDRGGIAPDSVRLLGDRDGVTYWVGLDGAGQICLVIAFGLDDAGSGCGAPGEVERSGLQFGFSPPDESVGQPAVVGILLPDSVGGADPGSPWTAISDNLLVADQKSVPAGSKLVIDRPEAGGGDLTFYG